MMKTIAGLSVIVAMWGGFSLPIYLIYRFTKYVLLHAPEKLRASSLIEEKTIKIAAIIGLILALMPGYVFSLMVGGMLGGGFGEQLSARLGLGSSGVPLGIFIGLTLFISTVVCVGVVIGTLLGKIFGIILSKTIMKKA